MAQTIIQRLAPLMAFLFAGPAMLHGQTVVTITQQGLGHPVPRPVESLEPVEGFRHFDSLRARFLALSLSTPEMTPHVVGTTLKGRSVEAFRFARDGATPEGTPRWGAFLNGSLHAREWASTEGVAGVLEWLALATDDPIRNYLLDTGAIVVSPLANPDATVVTHTYPDRVIGGSSSGSSGRDGRMRRKNLRDTDGILETTNDYLNGVDLNRNHAFGFFTGGSTVSTSITFRGAFAGSEPESQALYAAAALLPSGRIRFAIDYHSFGQFFYVITDNSTARSHATIRAYDVMSGAIFADSQRSYTRQLTPLETEAVGAVDEYFTGQFGAMGYTLEIRPISSTNGFILPNAEVSAMRSEIRAGTRAGLLYAAGPPALVAVTANGATLQARGFDPAAGRRITTNTGTISGAVDLSFVFNKPMRVVGTDGSGALLTPTMGSSDVQISSSAGIFGPPRWNHTSRWAGDTMTVRFQPHQGLSSGVYTVSINLVDLVGMELDGDPGSVADWSRDGWVGWEADRADTGLVLQYVEDGGTPGADGWELR